MGLGTIDSEQYEQFSRRIWGHDPFTRAHDLDREILAVIGQHDRHISDLQEILQGRSRVDARYVDNRIDAQVTVSMMLLCDLFRTDAEIHHRMEGSF